MLKQWIKRLAFKPLSTKTRGRVAASLLSSVSADGDIAELEETVGFVDVGWCRSKTASGNSSIQDGVFRAAEPRRCKLS